MVYSYPKRMDCPFCGREQTVILEKFFAEPGQGYSCFPNTEKSIICQNEHCRREWRHVELPHYPQVIEKDSE